MVKKKNNFKDVYFVKGQYVFSCPEIFNIYDREHCESSVRFVNSLDKIIQCNYKNVIISLVGCRILRGAAVMLLYAKLETILQNSDVEISIKNSIYPNVNALIKKSGIDYLCKNRKSENDITKAKEHYPILNGNAGAFRNEIVDFISQEIYQGSLTDEEEYRFSDAIQEAINNVYRHAYSKDTPSNNRPWWWMCSVIDDQLYLLLYDKGQGIPNTFVKGNEFYDQIDWHNEESQSILQDLIKRWELPYSIPIEELEKITQSPTDSLSISLAMSDDITRMNGEDELKHGQGSKSIRKLVADNDDGWLFIVSNRGMLWYRDEQSMIELHDMKCSINGTLVQWNIRIKND